jgi:hypothetical protein
MKFTQTSINSMGPTSQLLNKETEGTDVGLETGKKEYRGKPE